MLVDFLNVEFTIEGKDPRDAYLKLAEAVQDIDGLVVWSSGDFFTDKDTTVKDTGILT